MNTRKEYFVNGPARLKSEDARIIGPVLQELAEAGPVTARDVVEAAHSSNSPLHSYFEWDDKKAAESFRVGTAREIIRTVRVTVTSQAGVGRGLAAQRVSVRAHPVRIAQSTTVIARREQHPVEPGGDSNEKLERKCMDRDYYPQRMEEAHDIIDMLRERLELMLGSPDMTGAEYGMTGSEAAIYRYIRNRDIATKAGIYAALYGAGGDGPEEKIVDVLICKLRPKVPSGEKITTVWGVGYKLERDDDDAQAVKRRFTDHAPMEPERVQGLKDDHAAVMNARTLFPSTVVDPADSPALLVSGANSRKLGDRVTKGPWSGFPIYQLSLEERATCPRSCHIWNACYGNGMQLARRHRNTPDLIPYLKAELTDLQDEFPGGFVVRLHVLGDFYSIEYVNAWRGFLDDFPALHVFGYTAWEKTSNIGSAIEGITRYLWDRFAIRFSSADPQPQGATTIWRMPEDDIVWEGIVCPAQTDKTDCCGTCGLCWAVSAKDKTIAFIAHGPKSGPMRQLTPAELMRGKA